MDPALEAALKALGEAPDDEARRLVLTDLLLEQGDPRGEFVFLQRLVAANQAHAAVHRRIAELLKLHGAGWFRELEPFVAEDSVVVEGGFPVAARLRAGLRAEALEGAFACPMFTTLEEVLGPWPLVLEVLASPRMRALRFLSVSKQRELEDVLRRAWPHRLTDVTLAGDPESRLVDELVDSPVFSRTRTLSLWTPGRRAGAALRRVDQLPVLDTLRLHVDAPRPDWLPETWPGLKLRRLVLTTHHGTIDLERKAGGTEVLFHGYSPRQLVGLRRLVPEGTRHVGLICAGVRAAGVDPDEVLAAFAGLDPKLTC